MVCNNPTCNFRNRFSHQLANLVTLFTVHMMKEDGVHVSVAFAYLKEILNKKEKQCQVQCIKFEECNQSCFW